MFFASDAHTYSYIDTRSHTFTRSRYRLCFSEGLVHQVPQVPHLMVILKDLFQLEEIPTWTSSSSPQEPWSSLNPSGINQSNHSLANEGLNFHKFSKQWKVLADVFGAQVLLRRSLVTRRQHAGNHTPKHSKHLKFGRPQNVKEKKLKKERLEDSLALCEYLRGEAVTYTEDDLWQKSYTCEPRSSTA